jgi:hypothetical protein
MDDILSGGKIDPSTSGPIPQSRDDRSRDILLEQKEKQDQDAVGGTQFAPRPQPPPPIPQPTEVVPQLPVIPQSFDFNIGSSALEETREIARQTVVDILKNVTINGQGPSIEGSSISFNIPQQPREAFVFQGIVVPQPIQDFPKPQKINEFQDVQSLTIEPPRRQPQEIQVPAIDQAKTSIQPLEQPPVQSVPTEKTAQIQTTIEPIQLEEQQPPTQQARVEEIQPLKQIATEEIQLSKQPTIEETQLPVQFKNEEIKTEIPKTQTDVVDFKIENVPTSKTFEPSTEKLELQFADLQGVPTPKTIEQEPEVDLVQPAISQPTQPVEQAKLPEQSQPIEQPQLPQQTTKVSETETPANVLPKTEEPKVELLPQQPSTTEERTVLPQTNAAQAENFSQQVNVEGAKESPQPTIEPTQQETPTPPQQLNTDLNVENVSRREIRQTANEAGFQTTQRSWSNFVDPQNVKDFSDKREDVLKQREKLEELMAGLPYSELHKTKDYVDALTPAYGLSPFTVCVNGQPRTILFATFGNIY